MNFHHSKRICPLFNLCLSTTYLTHLLNSFTRWFYNKYIFCLILLLFCLSAAWANPVYFLWGVIWVPQGCNDCKNIFTFTSLSTLYEVPNWIIWVLQHIDILLQFPKTENAAYLLKTKKYLFGSSAPADAALKGASLEGQTWLPTSSQGISWELCWEFILRIFIKMSWKRNSRLKYF